MATRFVNVDRDTPMLLPPDLREWVPDEDMVHFVIEAVTGMNLPTLKINRRGCGSKQYPPKMMLTLLIDCYANGIFSSRRINAKRKHTVEPVVGIIKQVMGHRQTLLRGFERVSGDWGLVCLAYNFKRLISLQTA